MVCPRAQIQPSLRHRRQSLESLLHQARLAASPALAAGFPADLGSGKCRAGRVLGPALRALPGAPGAGLRWAVLTSVRGYHNYLETQAAHLELSFENDPSAGGRKASSATCAASCASSARGARSAPSDSICSELNRLNRRCLAEFQHDPLTAPGIARALTERPNPESNDGIRALGNGQEGGPDERRRARPGDAGEGI